jgi:isopentenyldiphosphate isomerase
MSQAISISSAAADGFMRRIAENNDIGGLGLDEMVAFTVNGVKYGFLSEEFAARCAKFDEVYVYAAAKRELSLVPSLKSVQARTEAVQSANLVLKEEKLIGGWRDEMLPVVGTFSSEPVMLIERAAYSWFGLKGYGVHVNGFVRGDSGTIDKLWVAKRAKDKSTWPGMLDHIVAGGQPFGITPTNNVIKECGEEAGIPMELALNSVSTGAVSYQSLDENGKLKRDSLFCFDLELPASFTPHPADGEVESFELYDIQKVIDTIVEGGPCGYKPNCNLVVMDFLVRHGFIAPESPRYLEIVGGLRDATTCK